MQAKNEILEELRSLSTVIDKISRQTPYGLPEGYFNDFPDFMMRRLMGDPLSAAIGLSGPSPSPSPFQVPEGYFEGFAGGVLARIKAGQGAKTYPGEPAATGLSEAAEELPLLSPLLSGISRKAPYQVPEGYFDELSPVLVGLGLRERPVYTVPEGYFEELAGQIVSRVKPAPARVIPIGRRGAWWKYSAAAVVAGLVLTIGWLRLHTSGRNGAPVDVAHSLYTVSDQEIQNYLDNHNNIIPPAEQDSTLNSTAALNVDENDVKNLLGDVPDGELKQYLEEHGGTKDAATN
jgi:hypothetical protein